MKKRVNIPRILLILLSISIIILISYHIYNLCEDYENKIKTSERLDPPPGYSQGPCRKGFYDVSKGKYKNDPTSLCGGIEETDEEKKKDLSQRVHLISTTNTGMCACLPNFMDPPQ